jgi:NAD(P)-dependent dehydrogenase (short-subunit alcohol dehydrogenase family)
MDATSERSKEISMARLVLVTGGSRGIGRATAELLARQGYDLALQYREQSAAAEALVAELRAQGVRAHALKADLARVEEVEALYRRVDELGPLYGVVNSAGVALPKSSVAELDLLAVQHAFALNTLGLIASCKEAVRRLSRARGGAGGVIVNVSSMAATIGGRPGNASYAATKAAVDAFSVGLAKEVADQGVRVVSVRPGMVATDMTAAALADPAALATVRASIPIGRAASAGEVAGPIAFLLSDAASFITGTCIDVSGGGFHIARG